MAPIAPFRLDQWARANRPYCKTSLMDSCVSPFSLADLSTLVETNADAPLFDTTTPLAYGPIQGRPELRAHIADLLSSSTSITGDDVVVTAGAILANYLVLMTLCSPGDHVVVQYPTYQQLYELPRSLGAEVSLWRMREEDGWLPDLMELEGLLRPETRVIVVNNPSNPTGTTIPKAHLERIVALAAAHDPPITILSDEVFRPLFHGVTPPPSMLDLGYRNVIVTGSVSKAFAVPGLRVGWVATPMKEVRDAVMGTRDYTSIAISQVDQMIAAKVLDGKHGVREIVLKRSLELCARNLELLEAWTYARKGRVSWVRPNGAGTAFVRIKDKAGNWVDDKDFTESVVRETGLMAVPGGWAFGTEGGGNDLRGYLRIGFVGDTEQMAKGLETLGKVLDDMAA